MGMFLNYPNGKAPSTQILRPEDLGLTDTLRYELDAAKNIRKTASRSEALSDQRMRLYQVLAPTMGDRGPYFGTKLALKEDWVKLDAGYFDAPGLNS